MVLIIIHGNKLEELVTSLKGIVGFRLYSKTHNAVVLNIF